MEGVSVTTTEAVLADFLETLADPMDESVTVGGYSDSAADREPVVAKDSDVKVLRSTYNDNVNQP